MTTQSVGIDMESMRRFKAIQRIKSEAFLRRVYTDRELDYCYAARKPWRRLAGRFAAKEATFKALSHLGFHCPDLKSIEIREGAKGMPRVFLRGGIRAKATVSVSLSRSGDHAVALAAAEAIS